MHHDIVIEKVGQGAAIISLSVWKSTPLAEVNLNFFWRFFSFLSHSVKRRYAEAIYIRQWGSSIS